MTAFIASNNYLENSNLNFATGALFSFSQEIARRECVTRKAFSSPKLWYTVNLPDEDRFLVFGKTLDEQSVFVKTALLTQEITASLFGRESEASMLNISGTLKDFPPEVRAERVREALAANKEQIVKDMAAMSAKTFVLRIRNSLTRDPEKTSLFLRRQGIPGIIFDSPEGRRCLLFSAFHDCTILQMHREKA